MEIIDLIRSFLTPQAIAAQMAKRAPVKQRIRNLVYGETGIQHPFSSITLLELQRVIKSVPIVRRGNQAFALDHGPGAMSVIDAHGFDVSDFLTAAEINNLKNATSQSVQAFIESRIANMLNAIQVSTEALCAQSLSGKISYPMKTDAGSDTYVIEYGTTASYDPSTKWDANGAKIMSVYQTLLDMSETLQKNGYGSGTVTLAGRNAFSQILSLADESKSNICQVKILSENEISVGGFTVALESGTYKVGDDANGKDIVQPTVAADGLTMVDTGAGHSLYYLALDDLENGLLPMPFFPSQEVLKNPSGLSIIGRSKPVPAPVLGGICSATVMTPKVTPPAEPASDTK